ncbi:MAG: tRNA (adenosine(37)-N6)-threonylcarbamoyltransferase complex dimerization subunit type 1 TsaB [Clostridia bacterium]|nr:tRNA (adenosine(37)-N6)-threonylcarbamoyltransferase complex dimerization subunit type 1 TsaB [Clostridia bacterium]
MLVLGIDSTSDAATAALVRDGVLLCEYTQNQKKTHSVKMLPMIEGMLSDLEIELSDIDVFACGIGPGSFTGVRIGASTIRAFCDSLNKCATSVTSLEALYNNVNSFDGVVISLVFARESECYTAAFENGEEILSPCVMTIDDIVSYAKGKRCMFVGDGAVINKEELKKVETAAFAMGRHNVISAGAIAEIGYKKALLGDVGNSNVLAPLYLRKSQAEREYDEKHKGEEK